MTSWLQRHGNTAFSLRRYSRQRTALTSYSPTHGTLCFKFYCPLCSKRERRSAWISRYDARSIQCSAIQSKLMELIVRPKLPDRELARCRMCKLSLHAPQMHFVFAKYSRTSCDVDTFFILTKNLPLVWGSSSGRSMVDIIHKLNTLILTRGEFGQPFWSNRGRSIVCSYIVLYCELSSLLGIQKLL